MISIPLKGSIHSYKQSFTNESANPIFDIVQEDKYHDESQIEEEMSFDELSSKLGNLHRDAFSDDQEDYRRNGQNN